MKIVLSYIPTIDGVKPTEIVLNSQKSKTMTHREILQCIESFIPSFYGISTDSLTLSHLTAVVSRRQLSWVYSFPCGRVSFFTEGKYTFGRIDRFFSYVERPVRFMKRLCGWIFGPKDISGLKTIDKEDMLSLPVTHIPEVIDHTYGTSDVWMFYVD